MLDAIEQEVERVFSDEAVDCSGIAVLLDGLNELPEGSLENIDSQISRLPNRVYKIVVTTRRGYPVPTLAEAVTLELCELTDDQIHQYLEGTLRDNAHRHFSRLQKNPRVLSMARNPFCLSLIAEKIRSKPAAGLVENRALLIEDFVDASIKRKRKEDARVPDSAKRSLLFTVLLVVAKWSLDSVTAMETTGRTPFFQSSHFQHMQDSPAHVFEALALAEKCGLLASMCLRCAEGVSNDLILELERKIRTSEAYETKIKYLPYDFDRNYPRPVNRLLPMYILTRFSFPFLLDLALNTDEETLPSHLPWFAAAQNVTQDHLGQLEQLWNSLPQDDSACSM